MKQTEEEKQLNNKKPWSVPLVQVIPFKNTKGGGVNDDPEDSYTNPQGS